MKRLTATPILDQWDSRSHDRGRLAAVIDEATTLGVERVQFIGGAPTLHPDLAHLISYALGIGISVEVFSNLVRVTPALWEAFQQPGVSLAASHYSPNADEHNAITRRHSHDKTLANVREAL